MRSSTLSLLVLSASAVLAAQSGCGIDHTDVAGKASTSHTIQSSGGTRSFLVHVPSNYNKSAKTGLILSYHGNGKDAAYQERLSQFSDTEYNSDWIAVYPQGVSNSWQGPSYATKGVVDTQFTADLLTYLRQNYCIDDTRVYASGKSNGGGFVGTLACDPVGGNFAAFAPVSGAFYTDLNKTSKCSPARSPLPIMEFHGAADNVIRYNGTKPGGGGPIPPIPEWLQRWAVRDGCSSPPSNYTRKPSVYDGKVTKTTFSCGSYDDIVTGYLIDGLGHDWPSRSPNEDTDTPTVAEATKVIMNFFKKYQVVSGKTTVSG